MSLPGIFHAKHSYRNHSVVTQRVDIGGCTNIRLLEFRDEEPTLDSIVQWVSGARLSRLRTLSLVLAARNYSAEWLPDLAALDAHFSSPYFAGLTTLRIQCDALHSLQDVAEKIQKDLPVTHARKILQVAYWT